MFIVEENIILKIQIIKRNKKKASYHPITHTELFDTLMNRLCRLYINDRVLQYTN